VPLPIITDTWRCAIELRAPGAFDPVVNVIHINSSATDASTFNADLCSDWGTCVSPYIQADWQFQTITYTRLDGSASVVIPWDGGAPQPGDTTHAIGLNSAACFSWRTPLGGRSNRGRSFIGPLTIASLSATQPDILQSGPLTAMQSSCDTLITQLVSDSIPLVVASYTLASARQVTAAKVNPKLCTQRRRVNGR
jgi:hypothetical protein